jgi:hypothetical protein
MAEPRVRHPAIETPGRWGFQIEPIDRGARPSRKRGLSQTRAARLAREGEIRPGVTLGLPSNSKGLAISD